MTVALKQSSFHTGNVGTGRTRALSHSANHTSSLPTDANLRKCARVADAAVDEKLFSRGVARIKDIAASCKFAPPRPIPLARAPRTRMLGGIAGNSSRDAKRTFAALVEAAHSRGSAVMLREPKHCAHFSLLQHS